VEIAGDLEPVTVQRAHHDEDRGEQQEPDRRRQPLVPGGIRPSRMHRQPVWPSTSSRNATTRSNTSMRFASFSIEWPSSS
jgi:hypothetical protein